MECEDELKIQQQKHKFETNFLSYSIYLDMFYINEASLLNLFAAQGRLKYKTNFKNLALLIFSFSLVLALEIRAYLM